MYYEDVVLRRGETVRNLVVAYGHRAADVMDIWRRHENLEIAALRARPEDAQPGDVLMIPIPWVVTTRRLTVRAATATHAGGGTMVIRRSGGRGTRLRWIQTVNRDNQPVGPNPDRFCVDGCTPDDDVPFYFTNGELTAVPDRRKEFFDAAGRNPPTAAQGTTRWRAIVSIAVVTRMRVTAIESTFWGFNITSAGVITTVGPRNATGAEIRGHLSLLRRGVGTSGTTFGRQGWTFREAPRLIGDFPMPRQDVAFA